MPILIFCIPGDSQEECLGCGKMFVAFSTPINGRHYCRSCSNETNTPQSPVNFQEKKFSVYSESGSEESYATEIEDHEEANEK